MPRYGSTGVSGARTRRAGGGSSLMARGITKRSRRRRCSSYNARKCDLSGIFDASNIKYRTYEAKQTTQVEASGRHIYVTYTLQIPRSLARRRRWRSLASRSRIFVPDCKIFLTPAPSGRLHCLPNLPGLRARRALQVWIYHLKRDLIGAEKRPNNHP